MRPVHHKVACEIMLRARRETKNMGALDGLVQEEEEEEEDKRGRRERIK